MDGVSGGRHAAAVFAVAHGTPEHTAFHHGPSVTLGRALHPQQDGRGQPGCCAGAQHHARQQVHDGHPGSLYFSSLVVFCPGVQRLELNLMSWIWDVGCCVLFLKKPQQHGFGIVGAPQAASFCFAVKNVRRGSALRTYPLMLLALTTFLPGPLLSSVPRVVILQPPQLPFFVPKENRQRSVSF